MEESCTHSGPPTGRVDWTRQCLHPHVEEPRQTPSYTVKGTRTPIVESALQAAFPTADEYPTHLDELERTFNEDYYFEPPYDDGDY